MLIVRFSPMDDTETLGHYLVKGKLGSGGMGDVYRATDTKLGRDVALKVLPDSLQGDERRLSRFSREARLLAALNHPNIATVHGFESFGERHVLVMELVPGETLHDRIGGSPLPVATVVKLFGEIAAALSEAHEKGIVHRDLKPANVMVTPDVHVKVLDFGLARWLEPERTNAHSSAVPTLTRDLTESGGVLGTPAYLSPEQARGQAVDRRADLWAFGCMLFEALCGQRAFAGETVSDTIVAVLEREPNYGLLPENTPASLRTLVVRCLEKDPERRRRDAGDVRLELEEFGSLPEGGSAQITGVETTPARRQRHRSVGIVLIAAALASLATATVLRNLRPSYPETPSAARLMLRLGEAGRSSFALSRDGTYVAYVTSDSGVRTIRLRALRDATGGIVSGSEDASHPFWSRDGAWLGFFTESAVLKVPVTGGRPEVVTPLAYSPAQGGSFLSDGGIVFSPGPYSGLFLAPAEGGEATPITELTPDETGHIFPDVLPGDEAVLFTAGRTESSDIVVASLVNGERRTILAGASRARYVAPGLLVFSRENALFAVPFDTERLETNDDPTRISGVSDAPGGLFSASDTGVLVYNSRDPRESQNSLSWIDRAGNRETLVRDRTIVHPRLSPDERRVLFHAGPNLDLWELDLARMVFRRLTFEATAQVSAIWLPDGQRIAYSSVAPGENAGNLYWMPVDGSEPPERLTTSRGFQNAFDTTRDGSLLILAERDPETRLDIWIVPLRGDRTPRPFLDSPFSEEGPKLSPDDRYLAFVSDESGRREVYVVPFPDGGPPVPVSTNGGIEPVWSRDGKELFYRERRAIMSVAIESGDPIRVGQPERLFETNMQVLVAGRASYDVASDGRFLVDEQDEAGFRELEMVLHFPAFLEPQPR